MACTLWIDVAGSSTVPPLSVTLSVNSWCSCPLLPGRPHCALSDCELVMLTVMARSVPAACDALMVHVSLESSKPRSSGVVGAVPSVHAQAMVLAAGATTTVTLPMLLPATPSAAPDVMPGSSNTSTSFVARLKAGRKVMTTSVGRFGAPLLKEISSLVMKNPVDVMDVMVATVKSVTVPVAAFVDSVNVGDASGFPMSLRPFMASMLKV
mmetsp:Transcript_40707/g.127342  ORF Transcript_40707/g.127342 Transcript_40707/m.127342 type:complete len:210 (+) Transcript_40707:970-1599(+)